MLLSFQSRFSWKQLLIGVILINSITFIDSVQTTVNLPINATWAQNATLIAGNANGTFGSTFPALDSPSKLTISSDDVLYISEYDNNRVTMMDLTDSTLIRIVGSGPNSSINQFNGPRDPFVYQSYLYVVDANNLRIQKWSKNGTNPSTALSISVYADVDNIFIDRYGNLYISSWNTHKVVRFPSGSSNGTVIAGTGTSGSLLTQLNAPQGIHVDDNLTLYIADCRNHRIQMWTYGASSGLMVAGTGMNGSSLSQLNKPIAIVLDSNRYMYIAETQTYRITRWALYATAGVCIAACSGTSGIDVYHFKWPTDLAFDSSGSLYVADNVSNRVLKFQINNNQNKVTTARQTTSKPTIRTSQSPSTVRTSSSLPVVSTALIKSSSKLSTINKQSTSIIKQTTTQKSFISSQSHDTTKMNYIQTSVLTKSLAQTTTSSPQSIITSQTTSTSTRVSVILTTTFRQSLSVAQSSSETQTSPLTTTTTSSQSIVSSRIFETIQTSTSTMPLISAARPSQSFPISEASPTVRSIQSSTSSSIQPTMGLVTTYLQTTLPPLLIHSTYNSKQTTTNEKSSSTQTQSSSQKHISTTKTTTISSTMRVSTTTSNSINCSKPLITLWPENSTLVTPLEIERNKEFSISSTLQLHCSKSLGVIQQWIINKCIDLSCSMRKQIQSSIIKTSISELFIPSNTLDYGIYQMNLTVQMSISSELISFALTYVKIISSPIQVYLFEHNPSIIIQEKQQILIFNPGKYSINPDEIYFDSNKWNYSYFCRIYDDNEFLNDSQTLMLSIEDKTMNPSIPSCFNNSQENETTWEYGSNSSRSSLVLYKNSLQSNQIYHFRVYLTNLANPSLIFNGDILVQIKDSASMTIIIKCIISKMCRKMNEYEIINPTTQIALSSFCIENCENLISNIQWNIYYGIVNSTNNIIQWRIVDNLTPYINNYIFGRNSNNLTITKDLLSINSTIKYWKFEVIYSVGSIKSVGLINFQINSPPSNGNCSINPLIGTITTLFTIRCINWYDEDGIKDYSFYAWINNGSNKIMIGYTTLDTLEIRMPIDNLNVSSIEIMVHVKDVFDCLTEMNFSRISIQSDITNLTSLMIVIDTDSLYGGNPNELCQVLTSVGQLLNLFAQQNLQSAIQNNISPTSISVSSLNQHYAELNNNNTNNISDLNEYKSQLNEFASIQEYLMIFINNLTISTTDNIILQSSTLSQLTSMTNQLTRDSLIIASTRCLELSQVLMNNVHNIPYEDVQMAATYIIECASNVLTGVNAPLQERVIVLNLDTNRANAFPSDYDTDLESEWSNPNLFADGDDFSEETINKNRNLYYQKQIAKIINKQFEETISTITNILNLHLNIEQSVVFNTSSIIVSSKKLLVENLSAQTIDLNNYTHISFPQDLQFDSTKSSSITLRCIQTPLSMVGNQVETNMNLSNLLLISFLNDTADEISVNIMNGKFIEFYIPRDINLLIPPMILQNVSSLKVDSFINNRQFNLHFINITQTNTNISISVHFEMHPLDNTLAYMLIYKFDQIPQLNTSTHQIDGWTILCPNNSTNDDVWSYFIDNQKTVGHQSTIFGIRELNSIEFQMYCVDTSSNILITDEILTFSSNYEVRMYTSGCYYLDSNNNWQSNGLLVGPLTNHYRTQCYSTHLSTFAAGFVGLPAPINWNYVFANADFLKNKTIYLTVIIIFLIYLILITYARYKDLNDSDKLGVTVLPDNQQDDTYLYQILVFTGHRQGSGTKSKVQFVVGGDDDETTVRTFSDPKRRIFQCGGIDTFIMAVPKSLGALNYVRIWHDNSGEGESSSWFLKYIIVRDLKTMKKFHFICQQWFAVEKGDGAVERLLPVAGDYQKQQFSYVLSKQAYHSVSENHLWFSILSRPPSNKFTRVQRCTCCFVLLFLTMFFNILYYDQQRATRSGTGLSLGPFYITAEQIATGMIVELLSLFPSLFLVQLFRRTKQKPSENDEVSLIQQALVTLKGRRQSLYLVNKKEEKKKKKKKSPLSFPWWCIYVAYILSFVLMGVSIFFTVIRGIQFGDVTVQKWLTSLIFGFISSIFVTQPIKVVCLAVFFAYFIRSSDNDKELAGPVDDDELSVSEDEKESTSSTPKKTSRKRRPGSTVNRLNASEVKEARDRRLKEMKTWTIIRQISSYLLFLSTLYIITYSSRNYDAFLQVKHLRNFLLNDGDSNLDYTQISTVDEYWKWLEESFVSNIRAQPWYNNDRARNLSGFINDKSNRLIGWATMRQLRAKPDSCKVQPSMNILNLTCINDYSLFENEEQQSFAPGWMINETEINGYGSTIKNAYKYRGSDDLDTYVYVGDHATYGSGGYVYEFRGRLSDMKTNLSKLHELEWIDEKTRAIIIQITLYNPNVEMFTSVILLAEFLSTGGVFPSSRFEPLNFQDFSTLLQLFIAIIYNIFIIYFLIIEIKSLIRLKRKYFRQFWSYIQWIIIVCSLTGIGIYVWRYFEMSRIGKIFRETNGYAYINLQLAVHINNLLVYLFGFCCFCGTIRCLEFCRYDQRLSLLGDTLEYAWKDIVSFAFMFAVMFLSFINLFYLLFASKIWACATFLHTTQTLFEIILMKFDVTEIYAADTFLGPVCFTLFVYFVVFIGITMFISIISDSFRVIRTRNDERNNEDNEMFQFILKKFLRWTGLRKQNEWEVYEERDAKMRSNYHSPVDSLPGKVDELFATLDRIWKI